MKKLLQFGATLLLASSMNAQTIPDASFESWTQDGTYPELYELDEYAFTSNICATIQNQSNCILNVTRSTDANSGTYAAKIATVLDGSNDPTSGFLSTIDENFDGIATSERPTNFYGYYKFNQEGSDVGSIEVFVGIGGPFDDNFIGTGTLELNSDQNTFASFNIPITYTSNATPDFVVITFNSAKDGSTETNGTYLIVDDISFDGLTTSLSNTNSNNNNLAYPNPATDIVNLNANGDYQLYTVAGESVLQGTGSELNVSNLENGIYVLEVTENGNTSRQKISVSK